jgi:mitochondrial fission protein ELM1
MQTRGGAERAAQGAGGAQPRIWLLLGEKAGDNAQATAIADAVGLPYETRRIAVHERWRTRKPRVRATLHHVDLARSDPLAAPWPDLVIAIGRRLSSVALWIREQSQGRTRLVRIGQPRGGVARRFDLVVASVQYRTRASAQTVALGLPLMRVDPAAVAAAARAWAEHFTGLARPLTALLVGGSTGPVVFDAAVARELADRAAAAAAPGSLYVTTSRRTPAEVAEALAARLPASARLYRWSEQSGADNPYLALLGCADRFVVTSDSITMQVEVARLGKPLAIFELPPSRGRWLRRLFSRRDLDAIPRLLLERGNAIRLGDPWSAPLASVPDELPRVAERIRALLPLETSPAP